MKDECRKLILSYALILSLLLSIIALIYQKTVLFVVAAILIIPSSLYLAATPLFRWWGLILPVLMIGAAYFRLKYKLWVSILLILPNFLIFGWLGYAVLIE